PGTVQRRKPDAQDGGGVQGPARAGQGARASADPGRRGLQPLRPGGRADLPLLPRHPGAGARGRGEPPGGQPAAVVALRPLPPRARADHPHRRADHEHGRAEPARQLKATHTWLEPIAWPSSAEPARATTATGWTWSGRPSTTSRSWRWPTRTTRGRR